MEKIRLKDKTEIVIEGGMTANNFTVIVVGYTAMKDLYDSLTEENLSRIEVLNDGGLVCAVLENKRLANERSFEVVDKTENLRVKVTLEDIDIRELQIDQLTANTDYLVMMQGM
jgi:hypothetical protein